MRRSGLTQISEPAVEAKAVSEKLVIVHVLEDLTDGTQMVGNSFECSVDEAASLIREGKAKAEGFSRGVVPGEWLGAVAAEVKAGDGEV